MDTARSIKEDLDRICQRAERLRVFCINHEHSPFPNAVEARQIINIAKQIIRHLDTVVWGTTQKESRDEVSGELGRKRWSVTHRDRGERRETANDLGVSDGQK